MENKLTTHRGTAARVWREVSRFALASGMMALFSPTQAAEDNTVTIVSWGGTTQDLERTSVWQPIAKELGISIKEDTIGANSDIKARVQANANTWDIVDIS